MAVSDAVRGDLVSGPVQVLHLAVVRPLVRHEEGGRYGAAVGVNSLRIKKSFVEISVQIIDSIVEGKKNELRCLVLAETSRDSPSTETLGERTILLA